MKSTFKRPKLAVLGAFFLSIAALCLPAQRTFAEEDKDIFDIGAGTFYLSWEEGTAAENTNRGWWQGAFGEILLPAGKGGVQYTYTRMHDRTDNAVQMQDTETGVWGTFYPFGSPDEFEDGWQAKGKMQCFYNGAELDFDLKTGAETPSDREFWHGSFAISVFRYRNILYTVCDFRGESGDRITAIYNFGKVEAALLVRLGGYCPDLKGTVARASSVRYEKKDCSTLGHDWSRWKPNADGDEERSCSRCGEKETRTSANVAAFFERAAAVKGAASVQEGLQAIGTALKSYYSLSEAEKGRAASEFSALEETIAVYGQWAQSADEAFFKQFALPRKEGETSEGERE